MKTNYAISTTTLILLVILGIFGCTAAQLASVRQEQQTAENIYAAATRATSQAKANLANTSPHSPGYEAITKIVAASEKGEQNARLALDLIKAAFDAAQKQDPNDPALRDSLVRAVSAIPSPWATVLASLLPAAIPLGASILQSMRLGRAHQSLAQITEELNAHKSALDALQKKPD